jgi:hypothetical protein
MNVTCTYCAKVQQSCNKCDLYIPHKSTQILLCITAVKVTSMFSSYLTLISEMNVEETTKPLEEVSDGQN